MFLFPEPGTCTDQEPINKRSTTRLLEVPVVCLSDKDTSSVSSSRFLLVKREANQSKESQTEGSFEQDGLEDLKMDCIEETSQCEETNHLGNAASPAYCHPMGFQNGVWFLAVKLNDVFTESLNMCFSTAYPQSDLPKQTVARIPRHALDTILCSASFSPLREQSFDNQDQLSLAAEQCGDSETLSASEKGELSDYDTLQSDDDVVSHTSDDSDYLPSDFDFETDFSKTDHSAGERKSEHAVNSDSDYQPQSTSECSDSVSDSDSNQSHDDFQNDRLKTDHVVHSDSECSDTVINPDFNQHDDTDCKSKRTPRQPSYRRPRDTSCLCFYCGKLFDRRKKLVTHLRISHTVRQYVCEDCGYIAQDNCLLTLHKNTVHLKIKKFQCTECGLRLYKATFLKNHIDQVHHNIRKYACTFENCNKRFKRPEALRVHTRTHTGDKPVKCQFCDYSARQKASLNWHMKTKHSDLSK